jgi:hypothetical protein
MCSRNSAISKTSVAADDEAVLAMMFVSTNVAAAGIDIGSAFSTLAELDIERLFRGRCC